MFIKIRQAFFTDSLFIEWTAIVNGTLTFSLKDDKGKIWMLSEPVEADDILTFTWKGLNDLPYGIYFLEVNNKNLEETVPVRIVKRV